MFLNYIILIFKPFYTILSVGCTWTPLAYNREKLNLPTDEKYNSKVWWSRIITSNFHFQSSSPHIKWFMLLGCSLDIKNYAGMCFVFSWTFQQMFQQRERPPEVRVLSIVTFLLAIAILFLRVHKILSEVELGHKV